MKKYVALAIIFSSYITAHAADKKLTERFTQLVESNNRSVNAKASFQIHCELSKSLTTLLNGDLPSTSFEVADIKKIIVCPISSLQMIHKKDGTVTTLSINQVVELKNNKPIAPSIILTRCTLEMPICSCCQIVDTALQEKLQYIGSLAKRMK